MRCWGAHSERPGSSSVYCTSKPLEAFPSASKCTNTEANKMAAVFYQVPFRWTVPHPRSVVYPLMALGSGIPARHIMVASDQPYSPKIERENYCTHTTNPASKIPAKQHPVNFSYLRFDRPPRTEYSCLPFGRIGARQHGRGPGPSPVHYARGAELQYDQKINNELGRRWVYRNAIAVNNGDQDIRLAWR